MNPADLAQDARITAANLLAIVDGGQQNTAYAVDKMREAAHLLAQLAALVMPPVTEDRDDDTFDKPQGTWKQDIAAFNEADASSPLSTRNTDKRREFFQALDMRETRRDGIRQRHIGHDIGAEGWHREQALLADKHRPRQDDIGAVMRHESAFSKDAAERIVNNTLAGWAQVIKDTDGHVTMTHKGVPEGDVSFEWRPPTQMPVIDDDDRCPGCGCSISKSEVKAGGCDVCLAEKIEY